MTDKQIIIDGVDVSGCKYYIADNGVQYNGCYELTDICECNKEDDFCDDNPNCYYKQLARKEQECEELEGRLKYIINENKVLKDCATDEHIDIVALKNYISTLEHHNDQLKAEVKSKTEYIQEQREIIDQYSKEIRMYKKCQGNRASKREEKLKQTLTEIEEITKNMNTSCFYDDFDCTDCDMKNGCIFLGRLKILQKIKACEVHND